VNKILEKNEEKRVLRLAGSTQSVDDFEEIRISDLLGFIWSSKIYVLICVLICTVLSILISANLKPVYKADVIMMSVDKKGNSSMSGVLSQFGGIAALAGIDVGGSNAGNAAGYILTSRVFLEQFIDDNGLLPYLFPARWDSEKSAWKELPTSLIDRLLSNSMEGGSGKTVVAPSNRDGYKVLKRALALVEDKKMGIVRLSVEWFDPVLAADWANLLVKRINSFMKSRDIQDTKKSIEFLNDKLKQTNVVAMQTILYNLIEGQANQQMLASVKDEYVYSVIDPAVVPDDKIRPSRLLIVILAIIFGVVLGMSITYFRNLWHAAK